MKMLVHALDTRPDAMRGGYTTRTRCGLTKLDEIHDLSAIFDDDKLPQPDEWSPDGYRWCVRCRRAM